MTIEQTIGNRVRRRRVEIGMSQEAVGEKIAQFTGKRWARQTVCQAELGYRDFKAADLLALAQVLGVAVGWLITPEPGDIGLTFSTGATVEIHNIEGVGRIAELRARVDSLTSFAGKVRASLDALGE